MRMIKYLLCAIWIFIGLIANSQIATAVLDINNLRVGVAANGMMFYNEEDGSPMYEVPADSGTHVMKSSQLWIGGMIGGDELHLAASTYNGTGHDFWSGPLSTEGLAAISQNTIAAYNHVWKVNQSDLQMHVAYFTAVQNGTAEELFPNGYTIPEYFFDWPAHGATNLNQAYYLAPFYDFNSDGEYQPENGDCPHVCGDQALYIIFNDKGGDHTESGGDALGVEIHAMVYAFGDNIEPHETLERTVFIRYRIINRSLDTFENTYFGQFADLNYGNPDDDHSASFVNYGAFSGTNGDELDEEFDGGESFGQSLGLQNVMFLRGVLDDANDLDDPYPYNDGIQFTHTYANASVGYGDGTMDNERLGLSKFVSFINAEHPIFGIPQAANDYYNYLRGLWKNGQPLIYNYSPFEPMPSQQILCDYMYPGVSDPEHAGTGGFVISNWSESSSENPPGDRLGLGSTGPFTFEPGEEQIIDLACVFSQGPSFAGNAANLDYVSAYFNDSLQDCLAGEFVIPVQEIADLNDLRLFPNPVSEVLHVEFNSNASLDEYSIINSLGQSVETSKYTTVIPVSHLESGVYTLLLEGDNLVLVARFIKN